jgi:hypothetical protein
VSADIPVYALGTVNTLRVLFQRQPAGGCRPREQGYPAAVLPGSHLVLGKGPLGDNFTGMVARFSRAANLVVPDTYLADPVTTLPRVARLANAAGVAPTRATLEVVANGQSAQPKESFLAADVALDNEAAHASFANGRLTLKGRGGSMLADLSGLANIGLIQVVRSGSTPGIVYRSVGNAPVLPPGMQLLQGDVAIVDASGVLKTLDTQYPGGVPPVDDQRAWLTRHWAGWGAPSVAIAVLVLLLLAAGIARKRARARTAAAAAARAAQESAEGQSGPDNTQSGS